jgi:MraZ protein
MTLFLSAFTNKIDRKGRVSVPASFRAALLGDDSGGIVLFRSNTHACLEGFAPSAMDELAARLDHFDLFSDAQDDLATAIFGEAVQLSLDGDGRVILPAAMIDYAALEGECSFVGLGRKFQIWSPLAYEERREKARDHVRKQGLTLPANKGGAS